MRFAVDVPNFGDFADSRVVADLARRAEEAGWDGLFVWDHVTHRKELRRTIADPWVLLTAAALAIEDVVFRPTPVQRPRVPVLVGGEWPARPPMRRAARWDGAMPILVAAQTRRPRQPDAATVREIHGFLSAQRAAAGLGAEPFDLVLSGMSPAGPAAATDLVGPLAEAGATWWAECQWDDLERAEPMARRVDQGPPPLA